LYRPPAAGFDAAGPSAQIGEVTTVETLADIRLGQSEPLELPARAEASDRRLVEA
jgi:hypothetical protein